MNQERFHEERQKIVRLLVKQGDVGQETITIHHSIPVDAPNTTPTGKSPLYPARLTATNLTFAIQPGSLQKALIFGASRPKVFTTGPRRTAASL